MSADTSPVVIQCPNCNEEASFRPDRLPRMGVCSKCASILFELEDELTDIRVTKEFKIVYRRLVELVSELRSESKNTENELKKGDGPASISHNLISDIHKAVYVLRNHNQLSDPGTRESAEGMLSMAELWMSELENWNESCENLELSEALSRLRDIRQKEKDSITFIKMMDHYLHERSVL